MKTKLAALLLAVFATILLLTPPAFARVYDPLLGVSWRPDYCADEPSVNTCIAIWNQVYMITGFSIAFASGACGNTENSCWNSIFLGVMGEFTESTCAEYEMVGGNNILNGQSEVVCCYFPKRGNLIQKDLISSWRD